MRWSSQNSTILAVVLAVGGASMAAFADDESQEMEEIVVTGTYIPRDNFDLASPLDVISAEDIAELGTAHMGDVLRKLTYNYGTATLENLVADALGEEAEVADQSFANLRGLGKRATLTLINGRRIARANANLLYPQIAVQRIEVLKDGSSPLYGSDAVTGVINFIPYRRFDGIEAEFYWLADDNHDYDDRQFGVIGGWEWLSTSLVAAVEYRTRDRLPMTEREDFLINALTTSNTGNPGSFIVPSRKANDVDGDGMIEADEVTFAPPAIMPDPGCGNPANVGATDPASKGYRRSGVPRGPRCGFDFTEYLDYLSPLWNAKASLFVDHNVSEHVRLRGEFVYVRQDRDGRFSPSFPFGRNDDFQPILGEHPGNPYRAFVDKNGNGMVDEVPGDPATNETLFAQDANGNGVPDRDLDGDGLADAGAELDPRATVLLAANPFAPSAGIAFNEDVIVDRLRVIGKGPRGLPRRLNSDGSSPWGRTTEVSRFSGGLDFDVGGGWHGNLWYTWNDSDAMQDRTYESFSRIVAGVTPRLDANGSLVGGLGPDGVAFWNPFSTSQFQCVNRVCGDTPTSESAPEFNTVDVTSEIAPESEERIRFNTQIVDALFTGPLMELPAGPLEVAVGAQWLHTEEEKDRPPIVNACDAWQPDCIDDLRADLDTLAGFFELRIPVLDDARLGNIEAQIAGRYTDEEIGFDSFDPKIALRYQPLDFVALRGSWSTSFVTPSLDQLDGPRQGTNSNAPIVDSTCIIAGICTPSRTFFFFFGGNPDLAAEEAEVANVGLSLRFLDGDLTLDVDLIQIDFEDRLARASAQDIVDLDARRFERFLADKNCTAASDPGACLTSARAEWIDPTNKAAGGFESPAIVRAGDGSLEFIETAWINSQTAEYQASDLSIGYRFAARDLPWIGGSYGYFTAGLDASYVDKYDYKVSILTPTEGAAGDRNNGTLLAPPLPRWRANLRLGWSWRNHSAMLLGHYIHHVDEDSVFNFLGFNPDRIPSRTTWDVRYSLRWDDLFGRGRTTLFSLGAINAFETLPPRLVAFGGAETLLHDPRGRRVYARITQEF